MSLDASVKYIILNSLKLSKNEKAVLDVLEKQKLGQNVSKIAASARVPRTTSIYILRKLERWKIARRVKIGKRHHWVYNKIIEHWGKKT